jgi:signal transduction histidine kinase
MNTRRLVRHVMDRLPDAAMALDPRGHVVLANAAALVHWRRSRSELIGADAHALAADIRHHGTGAPMMPPGALRARPRPIVGEGVDAQGRVLLLRCMPFFDTARAHAGWMIVLINLSDIGRAPSLRDETLRLISHDMREPNAAILTLLELARQRAGALPGDELLSRIEHKARAGLELADAFVNLARAEAERFRPEVLDLVALVRQVIDSSWAHARQRQVRALFTVAPGEALCIADRSLLTRALTNVLGNALKYSPQGADLECSVREQDQHWHIGFRDHGPGIAPAQQSQLFQPFRRLHLEEHPEIHGAGLGLLLVRTVVQRHGGRIEIDSAEAQGCTVTLVLPRPAEAEIEALESAERTAAQNRSSGAAPRA